MKVLWVMDDILPDYCEEFGVRKFDKMGWINGLLEYIENNSDMEVGLSFPLIDHSKVRRGERNNHKYYGFPMELKATYSDAIETELGKILDEFSPGLVHIWGTEYTHSLAMYNACKKRGMGDRVVINIQGLVSYISEHFNNGIEPGFLDKSYNGKTSLNDLRQDFYERGRYEKKLIKKCQNIIGRTRWDRACIKQINPDINYFSVGEILRTVFYNDFGTWNINKCKRHRIFSGQGSYPLKGFHFVLEALPILMERYPDLEIVLAGNSPLDSSSMYSVYIDELIEKLNVREKIKFLGKLSAEEMVEQYQMANVFVSASTIENSSNSICEAMMIGVPVVSSYVGGVADIIKHGESGFLYQADAPYMMAHYISELFEDEKKCVCLSKEGNRSIQKFVNRDRNGKDALAVYNMIRWG